MDRSDLTGHDEPLIDRLISKAAQGFKDLITYRTILYERQPRYGSFPAFLDERLVRALQSRGIVNPYLHQEQAIRHALAGKHVVVVTPTASGKTFCYNVPVLDTAMRHEETRALYIFPTKALSQDQMKELQELIDSVGMPVKTFTYDGDTPDSARQAVRSQGNIVITNPDMLHQAILPHHTRWQKLFANLRYVVIDEVHTYRGVFGSHVCNVIRRLKRICSFYKSRPTFICTSATIANPQELAERLLEESVELVGTNGAGQSRKYFFFINPPVINRELGIRESPVSVARKLAQLFIEKDIQTIVFARSRLHVEVLTKYLKDVFDKNPAHAEKIRGYRGGYLPLRRREIEKGLRDGVIKGVVCTNALELGIDIGRLGVCLMAGYPGTVASTWQQAGRAGRRHTSSAVFLIASSLPRDQYIIQHPDYFFTSPTEYGRINPDNLLILVSHIKCAAFELPFKQGETFGKENLEEILAYLAEEGVVHKSGTLWHWMTDAYPADKVSLRTPSAENFVVIDMADNRTVIGEVDYSSAPLVIHQGAIYMVEAKPFHVEQLDFNKRMAFVKEVETDYYTEAISYTKVKILDVFQSAAQAEGVRYEHGEVHVLTHVAGYKKIKFYTSENVGYGEVNLPDNEMITTSYWFTLESGVFEALGFNREQAVDAVYGVSYALQHICAIAVMSDVGDIRRAVGDKSANWQAAQNRSGRMAFYSFNNCTPVEVLLDELDKFQPTVFIYDRYPGGTGFSQTLWQSHNRLLSETLRLIKACPCQSGCPSCVGALEEKGNALKLLEYIMDLE